MYDPMKCPERLVPVCMTSWNIPGASYSSCSSCSTSCSSCSSCSTCSSCSKLLQLLHVLQLLEALQLLTVILLVPCLQRSLTARQDETRGETSAGFRWVVWWSRRPNFWSKLTGFQNRFRLRWFLSFALRIPTAHDIRVISARTWDFPQSKLDSEINAPFLLNKHGDLYFLLHKNIARIILFNFLKI